MKTRLEVAGPEQEEKVPESIALARALENAQDESEIKEKLGDLLDRISGDVGKEFTPEVTRLYEGMRAEDCLARVDQLSRVLETIELNKPLSIVDESESHYANAVVPVPEGIKIAFSEGEAPGPVRVVVGFGKTLIGFKTDHLSVEEIDFSKNDFRDARERAHLCRHVRGDLAKDDIHYLVLRIPYTLIDKNRLTEDEQKRPRPFVFRGMHLAGSV